MQSNYIKIQLEAVKDNEEKYKTNVVFCLADIVALAQNKKEITEKLVDSFKCVAFSIASDMHEKLANKE